MARPNSRQSLVDYALRDLGAPVTEINVDNDQIGDRLDQAIQIWQEYHGDAVVKRYYAHEVTAEDIENKYIVVPESFLWVLQVLPFDSLSTGGDFRPEYQMMLHDAYSTGSAGGSSLVSWYLMKTHLSLMENLFGSLNISMDYNRHQNRLHIFKNWGSDICCGQNIVIETWEAINPSDFPKVYNDMFLKELFISLLKRQWGTNLKKFGDMQLPGGVTINGQAIYDEAIAELQTIKEEMQLRYETPPCFFVG